MERLFAALGLIGFLLIAWALSVNRRHIPWRMVLWGMGLQLVAGVLVLGVPALGIPGPLAFVFAGANDAIMALLDYTTEGSRFIFGPLIDEKKTGGFVFATQVLPTILFVSSLMAVAYHWGVMQKVVRALARLMQRTMGSSGAESLSAAANIFVGQTEAPLLIRPYISALTTSELFAVMVTGMATVAGGVMAAYVGLLRSLLPDIAGHLLTASVMSAPAALVVAKLMVPEEGRPQTAGHVPSSTGASPDRNTFEAAARGAAEGLQLALNVAAMLLAFIALIALANGLLQWTGTLIGFDRWGSVLVPAPLLEAGQSPVLSLQLILGWLFAPLALLMGVSLPDLALAGSLLGEKIVLNEFIAYLHMADLGSKMTTRSLTILSYALCGFANFSSIAIQIGGIGSLALERRAELAALGLKAVIGGSLAAFLTASIAGILI